MRYWGKGNEIKSKVEELIKEGKEIPTFYLNYSFKFYKSK
jgi:hypothetical protein